MYVLLNNIKSRDEQELRATSSGRRTILAEMDFAHASQGTPYAPSYVMS